MTTEPVPQPLYSGARRHIARPDHPRGTLPTNIAFCGTVASPTTLTDEAPADKTLSDNLPACKRCSVAWEAYVVRLAGEAREAGDE